MDAKKSETFLLFRKIFKNPNFSKPALYPPILIGYQTDELLPLTRPRQESSSSAIWTKFLVALDEIRFSWPLVWPTKDKDLQYRAFFCGLLFLLRRLLYALVPYTYGRLTDGLSPENLHSDKWPPSWALLLGLVIYKFMKNDLTKGLQSLLWQDLGIRSERMISAETLKKTFSLPGFHARWSSGGFLSDFNKGGSLNTCLEEIIFTLIPVACDLLTTTTFVGLKLGVGYGTGTGLVSLLYICCIARNARLSILEGRKVVDSKRDRDAIGKSVLSDTRNILLSDGVETEISRFEHSQKSYQNLKKRAYSAQILRTFFSNALLAVGFLIMSMELVQQINLGQRRSEHLVLLTTFMDQLHGTLNSLGDSLQSIQKSYINSERLLTVLQLESTDEDADEDADADADAEENGGKDFEKCRPSIEFNSLGLGIPDRLNFRCPEKTTVAILGLPSPVRSKFLDYLVRFTDTRPGSIMIGGHPIENFSKTLLRQYIGIVPQEIKISGGSIMYNLKYGIRDAQNISDQDVRDMCKTVNLHQTILKLPQAYDTLLGQEGHCLSRDETRRLILARLLLGHRQIIVLEGKLSIMEGESKHECRQVMQRLSGWKTVILVDDETGKICSADQIIRVGHSTSNIFGKFKFHNTFEQV